MKKFIVQRIHTSNCYMIIKSNEDTSRLWKLPLKVYGVIIVEGCSYYYSRCSFMYVADEASSYLDELKQDALADYFEAK